MRTQRLASTFRRAQRATPTALRMRGRCFAHEVGLPLCRLVHPLVELCRELPHLIAEQQVLPAPAVHRSLYHA